MTITIRAEMALMKLQTTTGSISNKITKANNSAFAVRWIKTPECMYMFGSVERS